MRVPASPAPGALREAWTTLGGALVEAAWVGAHVGTYPWGYLRARTPVADVDRCTLRGLPPLRRALLLGSLEAAGTPILLVHGLADNRSIFAPLRHSLRRRGFSRILAWNHDGVLGGVERAATALATRVEQVRRETGYERLHIVGHSLGGIIARWYVQKLGGDRHVHTLVTLGSPHAGTHAARLLPLPVSRQLRPGSAMLAALAAPAPGCRTRVLSVWSDLDELVLPHRSAELRHPDLATRNIGVHAVGHLALLIDHRVVREIGSALAHLDPPGEPAPAGPLGHGLGGGLRADPTGEAPPGLAI